MKKKLKFDPEACTKLYEDLVKVFQEHKPTVGEIIIALGNLQYSVGASIGGYNNEKGPGIEELQKLYYSNPSVDVALMIQGLQTTTWFDDYQEMQLKKNKYNI